MIGVIIAAGQGSRLKTVTKGIPKTLLYVNRKPIIQWIIDEASAVGIKRFIIVTGYEHERIEKYFLKKPNTSIELVYNPLWKKGNGISVFSSASKIGEEKFVLMMSDHIISRQIIKGIINEKEGKPVLAVERNLDKVFDMEDATKVLVDGKRIISIGKTLKRFNGVDTGLFVLDGLIFRALEKVIKEGKDSLSDGVSEMLENHCLNAYTVPDDAFWLDIDTEAALKRAVQMWRCNEKGLT